MTVIVGYSNEGRYSMACDSCVSIDGRIVEKSTSKIYKFKEFIIGGTGNLKSIDVLVDWKPPKRSKRQSLDSYLRTTLLESLESFLTKSRVMGRDKEIPDFEKVGTEYLIVCESGIYIIGVDFSCFRIKDNFYAIGQGGDVALGAMECWFRTHQSPECKEFIKLMLVDAVKIASKYCPNVGGKIIYLDNN